MQPNCAMSSNNRCGRGLPTRCVLLGFCPASTRLHTAEHQHASSDHQFCPFKFTAGSFTNQQSIWGALRCRSRSTMTLWDADALSLHSTASGGWRSVRHLVPWKLSTCEHRKTRPAGLELCFMLLAGPNVHRKCGGGSVNSEGNVMTLPGEPRAHVC